MAQNYEQIERPYGSNLERQPDNLTPAVESAVGNVVSNSKDNQGAGTTSAGSSAPAAGGSTAPVIKNESQFSDLWIQNTIKSLNWKPKKQGFYIDGASGYSEFSNVFISGAITALSGTIGGWTIGADELSSGNVKVQSTAERILMGSAISALSGTGIFIGKDGDNYQFRVGNPLQGHIAWDGGTLAIKGGVVTNLSSGTELGILNWQSNLLFSSTNNETVAWTAGLITFLNGVSYSISAGDTGVMTDITYIYLDSAVSITELQTTITPNDAVGSNKVLVAVAKNNSSVTKAAIFQVFGGSGGMNPFITADNIAANSITANEIQANSITANELSTNLLFTGALTVDTNGHIKGGQTAYNLGNGFYIGWSSGEYKFSIGNPDGSHMNWSGTELDIRGSLDVGTNGIINNSIYTVANLPVPPTVAGFNNPSAYE